MNKWMDAWMDGWMDGWIGEKVKGGQLSRCREKGTKFSVMQDE